jgi:formate-dependent nitrite reductase cytochrome c552 subunit
MAVAVAASGRVLVGQHSCADLHNPGGEKGIRTLEALANLRPFQGRAFDHSAISPSCALHLAEQTQRNHLFRP